jgi:hypothetical protein
MYQQKCPIYQNSKAERDMVLLLMLYKFYPSYLAHILGFWVTCGVEMM